MASDKATPRTPRTPKAGVTLTNMADLTSVVIDKGESEMNDVTSVAGTVPAPTMSTTLPVVTPTPVQESNAAVLQSQDIGNSIIVPVTPVPLTVAQAAAIEFRASINVCWTKYWDLRPQGAGEFKEPTKAQLGAMRATYIAQYNIEHPDETLDATDMDDNITAAFAVKLTVDMARNAHAAAAADQCKINLEWTIAARDQVRGMLSALDQIVIDNGGSNTAPVVKAPRKAKASAKWSEIAPKLVAHATALGLPGVYFVDVAKDGYKGSFRAVRLHADGTWTKATFDPTTKITTDTGVKVADWKYFDVDGNDRTAETPADKIPAHSLSKGEMFGVSLVKADGTILDIDGVSHDRRDDKGMRVAGSLKHYALYPAFLTAAE